MTPADIEKCTVQLGQISVTIPGWCLPKSDPYRTTLQGVQRLVAHYEVMRGQIRSLKTRLQDEQARRKASERDAIGALHLVARIREAIGDNGRRMQDELVEHLRGLAGGAKAPDDLAMDLIEARQEVERVKAQAKHDYDADTACRESLMDENDHLRELLDGARNWVHDPVLRARITAAVPPKPRPAGC